MIKIFYCHNELFGDSLILFYSSAAYVPMVQAPVMPVVMVTTPVVSSSVKTGMLHMQTGWST